MGQILGQTGPPGGRIGRAVDDDVGHEGPAVVASGHCRLPHAGTGRQRRFHLARLDAEATDLHLAVEPTEELQRPVGSPSGAVARPVDPASRLAGGIGQEPLGSHRRAPQVAASLAHPSEEELAGLSRAHGIESVVEKARLGAR